ncbi:transposase [Chryseobacterium gallinarum]|uniref:transposase n=1 Tax=Chryseobacterium gallinarum TaxID=1324352 RepID=UPI002023DE96|nr:transposase [Chryseobacterium gallinarum]MCL8538633.1 transposase [Chryseobacterium gallinarum]
MNFKEIHIGKLIRARVDELDIDNSRIINFLKLPLEEIEKMYTQDDISVGFLLRWSKLLEYDFFRIYSHHLILYAPPSNNLKIESSLSTTLPVFRKNIYSQELIAFILEQINSGEMTKQQVIDEYRIPKTTLHRWELKYSSNKPQPNDLKK